MFYHNIHLISAVVIGFSEDDYTGDEGEPGDISRPITPCSVTVEIFERSLAIPLQIRLTPRERNATSKQDEFYAYLNTIYALYSLSL